MAQQPRKHTHHTAEFKREAVELALSSDCSLPQIAAELGISVSNLRRWKREYQDQGDQAFPGQGRLPADEEEMRRLRRELEWVKQERDILKKIKMLEQADSVSVLITGESGTGKELIARAVHANSARANGPFLPVNCATIPREMAESLLFRHRKGAFTGADEDQPGYFDLADGGTLFLDEVGDMPYDLQIKLLRVLEDGRVQPLGVAESHAVDVRVVAATNVDLAARIREGSFRQNLYYRIGR